jgi:hypothetical protein
MNMQTIPVMFSHISTLCEISLSSNDVREMRNLTIGILNLVRKIHNHAVVTSEDLDKCDKILEKIREICVQMEQAITKKSKKKS